MKYNGIELKEVTEQQLFNPPKNMLVWDNEETTPIEIPVIAIVNRSGNRVVTENTMWRHCAEIPEEPKKLVTYRELSHWLAEGNGEVKWTNTVSTNWNYLIDNENEFLPENSSVRKWDDTEWHKPTREYLGLKTNRCASIVKTRTIRLQDI